MKRQAAGRLCESFGLSVRRATGLVSLRRASFYYKPKTLRDDSGIIARMGELIEKQKSIGLPMLHEILHKEI